MDIEKKIENIQEKVEDRSLAMEILKELRQSNRNWRNAFFAMLIALMLTVGGFLWYLNQYDFTSSVEAIGVYTAVDKSGNIVAKDLSDEQFQMFMEWLNGQDKNNKDKN